MSDFTLLPANAANNGFVHSDDKCDRRYDDRDHCGDFARVHQDINASTHMLNRGQANLAKDICDNSKHIGDRVCDSTQSIKSQLCDSTRDVLSGVQVDGKETRANSERNGIETRNRVEENSREVRDNVSKYGLHNSDMIDRLSHQNCEYQKEALLQNQKCCNDTQKIVLEKTCEIKSQEAVHSAEMKLLQENSRIELLRQADTNRLILERQAADYHGDAKLQASENFCKLDKSVELSKGEIKLQAAENFAKAELNGLKQHSELQKQLSDCCCELKELVREQHCDTQMLFKNSENERLREQLAQAQREAMEAKLQPFPYAQCVSLKSCCGDAGRNGPPGQQ